MARSENTQSALWMTASMAAFASGDTLIKLIGSQLPLPQIIVVRGGFAVVLVFLLARHLGALRWRLPRRDWVLIAMRSVTEVCITFLFLTALVNMQIANATAVMNITPLMITLVGALFLGERVGWRRWLAVGAGFAGMVMIVQPGGEGFNVYSLYALGAVLFVTARDLITRYLSSAVPSMLVTLINTVNVLVFGTVWSLSYEWAPMSIDLLFLTFAAAMTVVIAYICAVITIRVGEMSAAAPFRYTGLLVALVLGWLVFGEWPDPLALLGGGIVVAAGLYTLFREASATATKA